MCFCGTCVGVGRGEGSHGVLPCGPLSLHPVSHLPLPLGAGGRGLLTLGPTSLWDRMMLGKCLGPCWLPGAGGIPRPSHVPDLLWSPPTSWHLSPALLYCGKGGGGSQQEEMRLPGSAGQDPPHEGASRLLHTYVPGRGRLVQQDQVPAMYDLRAVFLGKSSGQSQALTQGTHLEIVYSFT